MGQENKYYDLVKKKISLFKRLEPVLNTDFTQVKVFKKKHINSNYVSYINLLHQPLNNISEKVNKISNDEEELKIFSRNFIETLSNQIEKYNDYTQLENLNFDDGKMSRVVPISRTSIAFFNENVIKSGMWTYTLEIYKYYFPRKNITYFMLYVPDKYDGLTKAFNLNNNNLVLKAYYISFFKQFENAHNLVFSSMGDALNYVQDKIPKYNNIIKYVTNNNANNKKKLTESIKSNDDEKEYYRDLVLHKSSAVFDLQRHFRAMFQQPKYDNDIYGHSNSLIRLRSSLQTFVVSSLNRLDKMMLVGSNPKRTHSQFDKLVFGASSFKLFNDDDEAVATGNFPNVFMNGHPVAGCRISFMHKMLTGLEYALVVYYDSNLNKSFYKFDCAEAQLIIPKNWSIIDMSVKHKLIKTTNSLLDQYGLDRPLTEDEAKQCWNTVVKLTDLCIAYSK